MRWVVLAIALAGCPGPQHYGDCESDSECDGDVCARDGACYPASDVYPVRVSWTIHGMPASATTCAPAPNFEINFRGFTVNEFGFAPVPCDQGQFFIDKMPKGYNAVELSASGHFDQNASIIVGTGATGTAVFDLAF